MALLAFDSLVFGLTLYPVFKTRKTGIIAPVRVIMRDGKSKLEALVMDGYRRQMLNHQHSFFLQELCIMGRLC